MDSLAYLKFDFACLCYFSLNDQKCGIIDGTNFVLIIYCCFGLKILSYSNFLLCTYMKYSLPPILPPPSDSVFFIIPLTWCKIYKMAICICLLLILAYFELEFFKDQLKLSGFLQSLNSQNLLQYCRKSTWNRSDRIRGTTTVVR